MATKLCVASTFELFLHEFLFNHCQWVFKYNVQLFPYIVFEPFYRGNEVHNVLFSRICGSEVSAFVKLSCQ